MKTILMTVLFAALLITGCGKEETETSDQTPPRPGVSIPESMELNIVTSDSLTQTAWFMPTRPMAEKAPLIITLPMLNKTHDSYQQFIEDVRKFVAKNPDDPDIMMPNFLNFDLRGHGKSINRGAEMLAFMTMGDENFRRIPQDVAEMTAKVLTDYYRVIDSSRVVVVGASIGANAALMLTESLPFIEKVVCLSVGKNYRGMEPVEAFKNYNGEVLFVASEGDEYSAESTDFVSSAKDNGKLVKLYFASEHGTRIINSNRIAMDNVIGWIFGKDVPER